MTNTLWITYAWKDNSDGDFDYLVEKLRSGGIEASYDKIALIPVGLPDPCDAPRPPPRTTSNVGDACARRRRPAKRVRAYRTAARLGPLRGLGPPRVGGPTVLAPRPINSLGVSTPVHPPRIRSSDSKHRTSYVVTASGRGARLGVQHASLSGPAR